LAYVGILANKILENSLGHFHAQVLIPQGKHVSSG